MNSVVGEYIINDNYHDIYMHNLSKHVNDSTFINSPRGFRQHERLFTSFTLLNPLERVCYSYERKTNIIFYIAEVLWYLKGDNSLEYISYYCETMKKYSKDGITLNGTAYGPKIFSWEGYLNQWKCVCNDLLSDNHSKRAVVHIRNPSEMLIKNNIDATCTLTLQFLNRDNKLIMITSMRANDMYRGALSDVFSFTFLQELMSKQLSLELGSYHHQVGSSHIYEVDYNKSKIVLSNKKKKNEYNFRFPEMPKGCNWESIKTVLYYEERLRKNTIKLSIRKIEDLNIPIYWKQIINLFEIKRQKMYEKRIFIENYKYLIPIYSYFVGNLYKNYFN